MNNISVYVTIGNQKAFGITDSDDLVILDIKEQKVVVNLGVFTKARAKELQEHLERISIHAI